MVPEGRRVFDNLTDRGNLILGAYTRTDVRRNKKDINNIFQMFPRLKERHWQKQVPFQEENSRCWL